MVGLGLSGILALAIMKQISNSQMSQTKFKKKQAIDQFMDNISRQFASKDVCDHNFAARPVEQEKVEVLESARYNTETETYDPILRIGETYLNNSFSVEGISLSDAGDSKAALTVTFKKLKESGDNNTVKKSIVFPADIAGGTILSCYFDFNIISGDLVDTLASKICKGPGTTN